MRLSINLRHIETKSLRIAGDWPSEELDLDIRDELIHAHDSLKYDLSAERHGRNVLIKGTLELVLDCECIRCLKRFRHRVRIKNWTCDLPLEGEDRVPVENDCVDLTPFIRDDILLAFPQHPLCDKQCGGLPNAPLRARNSGDSGKTLAESSAWAQLDKLKL